VNPQDPLASLHPLREPGPIGWWPLAPGWWLLIAIALLSLAGLVYFLVKRYRANAYRRQALAQLQALREQYLAQQDASVYVARTNALLKSVALHGYPRRDIAASSGEQWLTFLNTRVKGAGQFQPGFVTAAYRKVCPDMDMEQLHRAAQNWIRRHQVAR
jgi:hypothetical protein